MDIKQRKQNRLSSYDYSTTGAYFVTICTDDRQKILSEVTDDGVPVLKRIGKVAEGLIMRIPEKYPAVSVDRFVIMPDHIHVLLSIGQGTEAPSPTLGNIIGWYKYQVTKEVNRIYGTEGRKLFQRSYYDHVIRNQADYNEAWEYIENNPRKWVIQKRGYE